MINKLPSEIILKTSRYLQLKDKLQLAKTCSRLYILISKITLFEELDLTEFRTESQQKIINMFQGNMYDNAQVKTLSIGMSVISEQLSSVFPDVTRVILGGHIGFIERTWDRNDKHLKPPISRWINTIQTFDMYSDWPKIFYLLKTHEFPRLSKLKLGYAHSYLEKNGFNPLYFAPFIKNAPNLTDLTLDHCDINLDLLEYLHSHCRSIKSFKLDHVVIVIDSCELPKPILPANSVLKLAFRNTTSFDRYGVLLNYIAQKYTKIQRLVLDLESDVQCANGRLGECFDRYSKYRYPYDVDDVYSRYKQDFNSGLDVYRLSGFKFFATLSKSLQTLKMNIQLFNGVIEAMGDSSMNLIELDFHDVVPSTDIYGEVPYRYVLDDADQLQFIHKLALLRTLKISVKSFHSLVWNYPLSCLSTSITQLSIECKYRTLYIDWVLDMFPSLERLTIDDSKCDTKDDVDDLFDDTLEKQDRHLHLQTLRIGHCSIYPHVLGFLKIAVPNMTHLSLHAVNIISYAHGGVYDIDLSSCNLEMFKMSRVTYKSPHTLEGNYHFAIQTDAKDFIYATSGEDISLTQNNGAFKKLENVSKIKSIEDDMESLMIF